MKAEMCHKNWSCKAASCLSNGLCELWSHSDLQSLIVSNDMLKMGVVGLPAISYNAGIWMHVLSIDSQKGCCILFLSTGTIIVRLLSRFAIQEPSDLYARIPAAIWESTSWVTVSFQRRIQNAGLCEGDVTTTLVVWRSSSIISSNRRRIILFSK